MERMDWNRLICDKRFGLEALHPSRPGETRSDFRRDYDRLVFSSPFRRLQNKTQVFPLPGSIFVHNRLTHSLEVSCVGRSLAAEVAEMLSQRYSGTVIAAKLPDISEIVAAACLAHDLGNPPFGHSGEKAISAFFSEGAGRIYREQLSPEEWADLVHFDGNANALRLLTHRFNGRRPGGFAMTYSTLASIVKYPFESQLAADGRNKFGFFTSEREDYLKVARELGITQLSAPGEPLRFARHPLVYLVEAADDICYEVMDIEDAHKLGILPTDRVIALLLAFFSPSQQEHKIEMMQQVDDPNERISYLRSGVIGALTHACAAAFVDNEEAILSARFDGSLLDHIPPMLRDAYEACNRLSWDEIYSATDVVNIELAGNRIITFLIEKLIEAVTRPDLYYSRLLLHQVPRQYQTDAPTLYGRIQAAIDHITGMTDVYALDLFRRLNGMSLKINN